jgi:hypothetical protein
MPDTQQPDARPPRIHGRYFLQALVDAGIIQLGDYVRRVVIDAAVDSAVTVYVERYGDARMLDVATTLHGVEIRGVPARAQYEQATRPAGQADG